MLFAKLVVLFYIYNLAIGYFCEVQLRLPESMAEPFGQTVGSALRDEQNQIWLYVMLAVWLTAGLQLLVTALARDYLHEWQYSAVCYTVGIPLLFSFTFSFVVLQMPGWKPPSPS